MLGHKVNGLLKAFPLIFLISFGWIAVFGFGVGMDMNESGGMFRCPFTTSEGNFCTMGVVEHISKWQQITALIPKPYTVILLLFVAWAIFIILKLLQEPRVPRNKPSIQFYKRRELEFRASNPLFTAFSDGILNPKIY